MTGKAEDSDFIFTKLEHSNEEGKNKKREVEKVFLIFKKCAAKSKELNFEYICMYIYKYMKFEDLQLIQFHLLVIFG